jgi:hypothetical protein
LFYGTGTELVRAVEALLVAGGFDVVDLDAELGGTLSADLLVAFGSLRRLLEVKSQGRNASESLVNDLLKHLACPVAPEPTELITFIGMLGRQRQGCDLRHT